MHPKPQGSAMGTVRMPVRVWAGVFFGTVVTAWCAASANGGFFGQEQSAATSAQTSATAKIQTPATAQTQTSANAQTQEKGKSSKDDAYVLPRGKKLVLKDGTFQLVRGYQRNGDRVRYLSAERGDWEEIPAAIVDWDATARAEAAEKNDE